MGFVDGYGRPLPGISGVSITEHNLVRYYGGEITGYSFTTNALKASEGSRIVYCKLLAGKNYLFSFDAQAIIWIYSGFPDIEVWKTDTLANAGVTEDMRVFYGWSRNFFEDLHTENGSYIYSPDTDVWVYATVAENNNLYVWDSELTGDINPGATVHSSFQSWESNENTMFKTLLNEYEDIAVSDEFKKGAIRSNDINRIYSGNVPVVLAGDSIMWAASNVGLEDSYRKNALKALDLPWVYHAVSGTTITDGYGSDWGAGTGYSGFVASESYKNYSYADTEHMYKQAKMVVLAMGTNDFGNDAPLGTVDDTGTDTFYGAFRAWLTYFQTYKPDMPIIVITPFKRDTWATPNEQNLILPDYIRAMYRVAREFKHVYLLDVFSKWYGDTDNQVIRARNSIDGIHPSAWFHDCFTMDLVQKIKEVCALEGIIA